MAFKKAKAEFELTAKNKTERAFAQVRAELRELRSGVTNLIGPIGLLAGAGGIGAIGKSLINAAKDAQETENLFRESFKGMTDDARQWSEKTSKALGLNAFDLRENSALIFNMTQSMGLAKKESFEMATGMTELANDMASFFNLEPDVAFQKLKSGITGEAEPLKALGILVDENTIKQAAYNHQLVESGEKLTQVQKVQARWLAILDQTETAQGDLGRTMDSTTNKERQLEAQTKANAISIGQLLIPAYTSFLGVLNFVNVGISDFFKSLKDIEEINERLGKGTLKNRFNDVSNEIDDLIKKNKELRTVLKNDTTGVDNLIFGTEDEIKANEKRIVFLQRQKKQLEEQILINRKLLNPEPESKPEDEGSGTAPVDSAKKKKMDALIKKFQAEVATESQKLQALIDQLNKAVGGGLSQDVADTNLTKRLTEISDKLERAEKAGINLEQQWGDLTEAEKKSLEVSLRRLDVLREIQNTGLPQGIKRHLDDIDSLVGDGLNILSRGQAERAKAEFLIGQGFINADQQFGNNSNETDRQIEERKRMNRALEDEKRILELLREPLDEAARLENILDDKLRAGAISALDHADAVKRLREEFGLVPDSADKVVTALDSIKSGLEANFTDVIFDATKGVDSLKDSFSSAVDLIIKEMIRLQVVKPLLGNLFGDSGSGDGFLGLIFKSILAAKTGGLSTAGNAVAGNVFAANAVALPGFASGGSFTVGGPGGTDKTPVNFMATRGERVIVQTPAQQKQGGGNTLVINMQGANGTSEIERVVTRALRRAAPEFINASVKTVIKGSQSDPSFLGA